MRGFWVTWSPDSPGIDAMKTRTEPGNPEAEKYLEIFTGNYKRLPQGNPSRGVIDEWTRIKVTPEKLKKITSPKLRA